MAGRPKLKKIIWKFSRKLCSFIPQPFLSFYWYSGQLLNIHLKTLWNIKLLQLRVLLLPGSLCDRPGHLHLAAQVQAGQLHNHQGTVSRRWEVWLPRCCFGYTGKAHVCFFTLGKYFGLVSYIALTETTWQQGHRCSLRTPIRIAGYCQ